MNRVDMKSGFTLVEILVTLSIISVVGILVSSIMINSSGVFQDQSSKLSESLGVNNALSKIKTEIKNSSGINGTYTDGATNYQTGANQLILKLPSLDSNGQIISQTFDYEVFFLDQDKFRLKVFPDTSSSRKSLDQILALQVTNLNFQYLDSSTPPQEVSYQSATRIRVTINSKNQTGQNTATSEANLRNE